MFCLMGGARKLKPVQHLSLGGMWESHPQPLAWHKEEAELQLGPALGTGSLRRVVWGGGGVS